MSNVLPEANTGRKTEENWLVGKAYYEILIQDSGEMDLLLFRGEKSIELNVRLRFYYNPKQFK